MPRITTQVVSSHCGPALRPCERVLPDKRIREWDGAQLVQRETLEHGRPPASVPLHWTISGT
eukprot:3354411-Rhodomonas_salina.3